MTTKEINQLKAFTTMPHINERPPYARHTVFMPRVASLTATGNNVTFLTELGFEQMRTKKGRFWKVAERPVCDIDSRIPEDDPNEMKEAELPF